MIVVDPAFAERLDAEAEIQPVWLCDTPINRRAAEIFWAKKPAPPGRVTTFRATGSGSREQMLLDILDTVDMHHPSWTRLRVIGVQPSAAIQSALAGFGPGSLEAVGSGFAFERLPPG
ncbi:hypothetical protein [Methylocystis parvus]|uniref:hypothetical protein n=1 Tax=Methylocystis parvus TaxID=134 RepID=UPI003C7541E5